MYASARMVREYFPDKKIKEIKAAKSKKTSDTNVSLDNADNGYYIR